MVGSKEERPMEHDLILACG